MRILVTGQCTVHLGRLEYGNIGNYYMVEPTFRELHRVFPSAEIVTTFQMTECFCMKENVSCLPMELFYSWSEDDLTKALEELGIVTIYNSTGKLVSSTPYIDEVLKSDIIIDFSGEMWGYHAELVGKNRFLIGLLKNRTAQLLNKPVIMLAGSPGPFTDERTLPFAKQVFKGFKFIANREAESINILERAGFDTSYVKSYACPSFLFESKSDTEMADIYRLEHLDDKSKKIVGFVLCGFNFIEGPYDKWPRMDHEYLQFAETIEYIVKSLDARVVLMSHSNGFDRNPDIKLKPGRDYPIVKQLQDIILKRRIVDSNSVLCIDNVYTPAETKAIIQQFDMLVTGRLHASVAALSQCIPTVIIKYGHGPEPHKTIGFSKITKIQDYVASPLTSMGIIEKVAACWNNIDKIRLELENTIPEVKKLARRSFDDISKII